MVDKEVDKILELMEIDNIVDKTIALIKKDCCDNYDEYYNNYYIDKYFLNKKEYMKFLIEGEITNNQREIHDLIEEYQLEANKKFMKKLVKLEGYALKYASEELKNNKEVVLEAVKQNGKLLQYASEELRNDKEVVQEAVKNLVLH